MKILTIENDHCFSEILCGGPWPYEGYHIFLIGNLTIKNDHVSDLVSLKYFVVVLGLLVLILTGTIIGMTQVSIYMHF